MESFHNWGISVYVSMKTSMKEIAGDTRPEIACNTGHPIFPLSREKVNT